jgi:hypothetical protein
MPYLPVDLEVATGRLLDELSGGPPVSAQDTLVLQRELDRRLRRRFPTLTRADRDDLISDGILKFVVAARDGRIERDGSLGGYLWTIVFNRAVDESRRPASRPMAELDDEADPLSDSTIAAFLDADASTTMVTAAMRHAVSIGDYDGARWVAEWLVLAEELGRAPSLREAGEALGISYATVRRTLERFALYLVPAPGDPG